MRSFQTSTLKQNNWVLSFSGGQTMIRFTLNGEHKSYEGDGDLPLLKWLRNHEKIRSVKDGCSGQGACGACLLEMNGKAVLSCRVPMKKVEGAEIVTIEGFPPVLKDILAKAFVSKGAVQCGFCTPGFLSRTKILLEQTALPTREQIKKAFAANICRCTGYVKIIDAVIAAAEAIHGRKELELSGDFGIGKSSPKHEAYEKALGRSEFIDDMVIEGMLFGALRFSDHPRAEVLSIEVEKAEKFPGVIRVFTAKDIPGDRITGTIFQDWPVMVEVGEITRYIGDVLAGVVAETEDIARQAAALIEVKYNVLTPVTDPFEALKNEIKVHDRGNLLSTTEIHRGENVDEVFSQSAFTVQAEYRTQMIEHAYMETEASIGIPSDDGTIRIYSQSQGIYEDRHAIAKILGIPKEKVIVTLVPCGGAFGGKEDLTVQGHAAVFAWLLKKPVKVRFSREESIRMHPKRHPMILKYRIGCDEKGKLTALSADITGDTGAYASIGASVLERSAGHATGGYHVPSVSIISRAVYTNNIACGPMRGFGVNQVTFAMECLLDELIEKGGFDPWQFRYDNALKKGSQTATGQILGDGVGLRETLLAVQDDFRQAHYAGIALAIKNVGFGNGLIDESEAEIEIIDENHIRLHHGWTEMGQGVDTIAKQVFTEVTGIKNVLIDVVSSTDSEVIGGATTASRGTFLLGNALIIAAKKLKKDLEQHALRELTGRKYKGKWTCDWTTKPGEKTDGETHFAYGYATQVVILDEKGQVSKVVAAHDAGKVFNPILFEGQIEGAVMMGLGYALTEKLELNQGYLVSDKFAKLGIPKIKSLPEIMVKIVEVKDPRGPFGAKGVGEIGLVPTAPAVVNALYRFDGKRRYQLPITDI